MSYTTYEWIDGVHYLNGVPLTGDQEMETEFDLQWSYIVAKEIFYDTENFKITFDTSRASYRPNFVNPNDWV